MLARNAIYSVYVHLTYVHLAHHGCTGHRRCLVAADHRHGERFSVICSIPREKSIYLECLGRIGQKVSGICDYNCTVKQLVVKMTIFAAKERGNSVSEDNLHT